MQMNSSKLEYYGILLFTATVTGCVCYYKLKSPKTLPNLGKKVSEPESTYFPPLPSQIVDILKSSKLCMLASQAENEPHLSLMNFTYYQIEEIIIFCTKRSTKKFNQISQSPKVAILVHDFPHLVGANQSENHGRSWSITLNGICKIYDEHDEDGERYREIHLQQNLDYSQFISGSADIAVMVVSIEKARLCDLQDRVTHWSCKDGFQN